MTDSDADRAHSLEDASAQDWLGSNQDPDVFLSIPDLGVEKITLNVEDLEAHVDLHAKVLDIVEIHVGADATLGKVELNIENVSAQAMLKVKLDKVAQIVDRVMRTIDNNPEILTSLTRPIGRGVEKVGQGAGEGVREVGRGAGEGVREVAQGAGEGVREVGRGAGEGVGEVGRGAGEGVREVGRGAGKGASEVGQGVGDAGRSAGEGVRDVAGKTPLPADDSPQVETAYDADYDEVDEGRTVPRQHRGRGRH
ncbi:hypothetical protein ABN028_21825 [Actinopolymorpha sp. B17G11]|uniref:hypothetical protein n=1 Tax=Actinopolymorpha sp. B17G11 TaxID=3160861 RepID=UPI0032E38983